MHDLKNCIILHFCASCRIKEKCANFFFFFFFFALWLEMKIQKGKLTKLTSNKGSTTTTTKQNKEYVLILLSS